MTHPNALTESEIHRHDCQEEPAPSDTFGDVRRCEHGRLQMVAVGDREESPHYWDDLRWSEFGARRRARRALRAHEAAQRARVHEMGYRTTEGLPPYDVDAPAREAAPEETEAVPGTWQAEPWRIEPSVQGGPEMFGPLIVGSRFAEVVTIHVQRTNGASALSGAAAEILRHATTLRTADMLTALDPHGEYVVRATTP